MLKIRPVRLKHTCNEEVGVWTVPYIWWCNLWPTSGWAEILCVVIILSVNFRVTVGIMKGREIICVCSTFKLSVHYHHCSCLESQQPALMLGKGRPYLLLKSHNRNHAAYFSFSASPHKCRPETISIHFCTKQLHIFFQQICQMGQTFNGSRFSYARILNLF